MGSIIKFLPGLIQKLSGRVLSNKGIDPKVSSFALPLAIVEVAMAILGAVDPALLALVEPHQAAILEIAAMVGALLAYFTPNDRDKDGVIDSKDSSPDDPSVQ